MSSQQARGQHYRCGSRSSRQVSSEAPEPARYASPDRNSSTSKSPERRPQPAGRSWRQHLMGYLILSILVGCELALGCGPGRAGGRLMRRRRYPPLVRHEYIPNVSENTLGASGRPEGAIGRHSKRFEELVKNLNPDIEFRDDERTGADRMMSPRLKEKLSVLAISVMNQWPNVRLRVIEGWDEDHRHSVNSLHYEGRAVDITTSDKDKSKYGMLARLAVEAGFDWVHYESRSHVHCSVKSERADTIRNNGCFDAKSLVQTPKGQMEMSQLQTNDLVLTMEPTSGKLQFSPVIMWLDRDVLGQELFVELRTESGQRIHLTSSHLIYVADEDTLKDQQNIAPPDQWQQIADLVELPTGDDEIYKGPVKGIDNQNYYYNFDTQQDNIKPNRNMKERTIKFGSITSSDSAHPVTKSNIMSIDENSPINLEDFVYTTYARNALVGQYLLTNTNADQPIKSNIDQVATKKSRAQTLPNSKQTQVDEDMTPTQIKPIELNERASDKFTNRLSVDTYQIGRLGRMDRDEKVQIEILDAERQLSLKQDQISSKAESRLRFDRIVSVNYVTKEGIYAPLTREGNIVVNSVVASCYALISDHSMAHLSFAPVRWLSYLNELLFGLRPETPTESRTVEHVKSLQRLYDLDDYDYVVQQDWEPKNSRIQPIDKASINGLDRTKLHDYTNRAKTDAERKIHWYPMMLFNIARFILPSRYLY